MQTPKPPTKPLTYRSPCPHPKKLRFRDEIAAKMELAKIIRRDNTARPKTEKRAYPCIGHWHLTSEDRPKIQQQKERQP